MSIVEEKNRIGRFISDANVSTIRYNGVYFNCCQWVFVRVYKLLQTHNYMSPTYGNSIHQTIPNFVYPTKSENERTRKQDNTQKQLQQELEQRHRQSSFSFKSGTFIRNSVPIQQRDDDNHRPGKKVIKNRIEVNREEVNKSKQQLEFKKSMIMIFTGYKQQTLAN